jgi:Na+/glutamate symporter
VLGFITSTFGSLVADWSVDNMIPYQLSLDVGESQQTKKKTINKQTKKKKEKEIRDLNIIILITIIVVCAIPVGGKMYSIYRNLCDNVCQ